MDSPQSNKSNEDIFDSSLNLEESLIKEGYVEGYNHGLTTGKEEARQVGLKLGFETGEELGFYKGCVDLWNSVVRVDPTRFSSRVQKGIKQMEELIEKYPVMDPENESIQEIMEALRLKFRIIRAALGVKLEYDGYPKAKEIEFWVDIYFSLFIFVFLYLLNYFMKNFVVFLSIFRIQLKTFPACVEKSSGYSYLSN